MTPARFWALLNARVATLAHFSPVAATHPAAMSYGLGLRVESATKKAQKGPVVGGASTDSITGRLLDDPTSEHATDRTWKQGYSAAEAYGKLLDEEFGAGAAAEQEEFAALGAQALAASSGPAWLALVLANLPSLADGDARANVARYVFGTRDETKLAALAAEGHDPMQIDRTKAGSLFRLIPSSGPTVDPSTIRLFNKSGAPAETPPATSSSSTPVIGGVAGAALGAAAGYFLGGRSLVLAGVGAAVGGGAGYLGTSYATKPAAP